MKREQGTGWAAKRETFVPSPRPCDGPIPARSPRSFGLRTGPAPEAPRAEITLPAAAPGGVPESALKDLPREAHRALDLIRTGGPFPYGGDGTVLGNRKRLLPA